MFVLYFEWYCSDQKQSATNTINNTNLIKLPENINVQLYLIITRNKCVRLQPTTLAAMVLFTVPFIAVV